MSDMGDMPPLLDEHKHFNNLCRNVFGSGQGLELLKLLKARYCDSNLYQETDRATVYCIAQRDIILELEDKVKSRSGENRPKPDGVETNE